MKINNRYEIRIVIIEIREGIGVYRSLGDIYDNFEEFKKDKPDSDYKFGYIVFDTEYGYVPDECNDWNDSVEEAMWDYHENVEKFKKESSNEPLHINVEEIEKVKDVFKKHNTYIISEIDGHGVHMGEIKNIALDANDSWIIEADIESVSVTE